MSKYTLRSKLEDLGEVSFTNDHEVLLASIAISLKRLADRFDEAVREAVRGHGDRP